MVASITTIYDELQAEQLRKIDSFIEFLKKSSCTLRKMDTLTVLHQAQRIWGSVPKKVQFYISEKLDVSITEIEALINFYEYFTKEASANASLSVRQV
ncbi:MAG TPA: NAD(P)H-dependent oxidoreductase subunit E [Chitinispirillaceae bacterium]|nr:NAD(P)H-dependent oxidoreductase subunit E [Chitinispirillaceae bacterium]